MYQYLLNKYGVRLTLPEVSEVLKVPVGTLRNWRTKNKMPFNTYRDGMKVYVDAKTLSEYLESRRKNG